MTTSQSSPAEPADAPSPLDRSAAEPDPRPASMLRRVDFDLDDEQATPDLMAALEGVFKALPADYERERRELPQKILAERNALAAEVAKLIAENARLRQELDEAREQRDTAQNELAEISTILAPYDNGGSFAFQVQQLARELDATRAEADKLRAVLRMANATAERRGKARDAAVRAESEAQKRYDRLANAMRALHDLVLDDKGDLDIAAQIRSALAATAPATPSSHDPYNCPNGRSAAQCLLDCDHPAPATPASEPWPCGGCEHGERCECPPPAPSEPPAASDEPVTELPQWERELLDAFDPETGLMPPLSDEQPQDGAEAGSEPNEAQEGAERLTKLFMAGRYDEVVAELRTLRPDLSDGDMSIEFLLAWVKTLADALAARTADDEHLVHLRDVQQLLWPEGGARRVPQEYASELPQAVEWLLQQRVTLTTAVDKLRDALDMPREAEFDADFAVGAIRNMVDTARITRTQLRPQLARAEADLAKAQREAERLRGEVKQLLNPTSGRSPMAVKGSYVIHGTDPGAITSDKPAATSSSDTTGGGS